jgi:uncharacterized protein YjbI with pentapeptide repeats
MIEQPPTSPDELLCRYAAGERLFVDIEMAPGASLRGVMLCGACFENAWLHSVDFARADLRHCKFNNVNLKCVDFSDANLTGASFDDVVLCGSVFTGAKIGDTSLRDVESYGATITSLDQLMS